MKNDYKNVFRCVFFFKKRMRLFMSAKPKDGTSKFVGIITYVIITGIHVVYSRNYTQCQVSIAQSIYFHTIPYHTLPYLTRLSLLSISQYFANFFYTHLYRSSQWVISSRMYLPSVDLQIIHRCMMLQAVHKIFLYIVLLYIGIIVLFSLI